MISRNRILALAAGAALSVPLAAGAVAAPSASAEDTASFAIVAVASYVGSTSTGEADEAAQFQWLGPGTLNLANQNVVIESSNGNTWPLTGSLSQNQKLTLQRSVSGVVSYTGTLDDSDTLTVTTDSPIVSRSGGLKVWFGGVNGTLDDRFGTDSAAGSYYLTTAETPLADPNGAGTQQDPYKEHYRDTFVGSTNTQFGHRNRT